ncbi:MAG: ABC transporter ATP-binding protein, partial [Clostridiales bacterium]|nr:ABC transporter ATP-binding protein [Clostridiales bacterium]
KKDARGNLIPIWEYEVDDSGEFVLDENGEKRIKRRQKLDKKGQPMFDKEGEPIYELVQKTGNSGVLQFEMEEHVYDIAKMPVREMTRIRGRQISMIFEEPMTSLNRVLTSGSQLDEVSLLHLPGADKKIAKAKSLEMLDLVGIAMPERVYKSYPHELSGGMRQRVMIAMALACNPRLIIADEPTTALDVTIQAQVLDLLRDIKQKIDGSIMLITHDLGIIAEMADFVVVMYAGRIVEMGLTEEIFDHPMHPYTIGLQKSKPAMNSNTDRLFNIPGNVPNPINMPEFCYFKERCSRACPACNGKFPEMVSVSPTHKVACYLYGKEAANGKEEK